MYNLNRATNYSNLLELNKKILQSKLDKVTVVNKCYKASELLYIISDDLEKNKNYINKFDETETSVFVITVDNYKHRCKFLTIKGICRILHEGAIIDYINTCEYFNIKTIDLDELNMMKKINKYLYETDQPKYVIIEDKMTTEYKLPDINYKTALFKKTILSWVFDKPKTTSKLDSITDLEEILKYLATLKIKDNECIDRYNVLLKLYNS